MDRRSFTFALPIRRQANHAANRQKTPSHVWGDSVAAHYVYGLQRAAAPYDVTIWQMTEGGCVPIPDYDWPDDPGCRAFNDGVRSLIRTRKPDAVLVSGLWGPAESRLGREEFDARMQSGRVARDQYPVPVQRRFLSPASGQVAGAHQDFLLS